MDICDFYIANTYEMVESIQLIKGENKKELLYWTNVGNFTDSIHAVEPDDTQHSYFRWYPHGHYNKEGNKIEFYYIDCDELYLINHTEEDLVVDNTLIMKPNEKILYFKKEALD